MRAELGEKQGRATGWAGRAAPAGHDDGVASLLLVGRSRHGLHAHAFSVGSTVQVPQLWCLVCDRCRRVKAHCCESVGAWYTRYEWESFVPLWHAMKCETANLPTRLRASALLLPCSSRAVKVFAGLAFFESEALMAALNVTASASGCSCFCKHMQATVQNCKSTGWMHFAHFGRFSGAMRTAHALINQQPSA